MPEVDDAVIDAKAAAFADAIAHAEGYFVPGSLPFRTNNPGDMELGDRGNGVLKGKTVYATAEDGFAALRRECTAILTGASVVYSVNWTFLEVANKWTGNDDPDAWCNEVCSRLKTVFPSTTIREYVLQ